MDISGLSELAMWEDWQEIVRRNLPNFAASPIYVQQRSQTQEDFEIAAEYVARRPKIDPNGKTRDAEFGGIVRQTRALGAVTRMWIDSNVEADFLRRHLDLQETRALDIGAGYGRLAVALSPIMRGYYCVDAVPISTEICREYLHRFAPMAGIFSLSEFGEIADTLAPDLAINIHSWNECSLPQIARWLGVLRAIGVPMLFTVSNGKIGGGKSAYASWGGGGESFRPLLEAQYDLIAEESIGLSSHPHALWRLK